MERVEGDRTDKDEIRKLDAETKQIHTMALNSRGQ